MPLKINVLNREPGRYFWHRYVPDIVMSRNVMTGAIVSAYSRDFAGGLEFAELQLDYVKSRREMYQIDFEEMDVDDSHYDILYEFLEKMLTHSVELIKSMQRRRGA